MLEGLAAWILNTYVGEYVENLNTDQLSIGLLQGEVELENLPLKKDALNHLGLPVEIRAGFVEKVKLQIPVYRLRSEPWVISVERLFLIAGPVLSFQYNEEEEEQSALRRKLARLEALEAKWKAAHEVKNESSSSYGGWLSYGTSLVANIVENVQLKIKDVHIRYEDKEICSNSCFACGIIIHGLSAQSTDQNWIPKFVTKDVSDMMWKLVELDGLSVYWDTNATILGHLDRQQMTDGMAKHVKGSVSSDGSSKDHDYILAPVHAKANLQRNCCPKPLRSRSTPRIICDINLEKIQLMLSENQYKQIMEWEHKFESLDVKWKYRKWRPEVPVKNNAQKWWFYAASVFVEPLKHQNETNTWTYVLQRARDIVQYSKVYHKYLSSPENFQPSEQEIKTKLEAELDFEELSILRDIVMEKIQEENILQKKSGAQSKGQGFLQWMFPRWGGWYASQPVSESEEIKSEYTLDKDIPCKESSADEENLKTTLEEGIMDVLDNADNDTLLKRDSVFALVNFCLSQGSCTLLGSSGRNGSNSESGAGKPIIELEFSDVATKLETRPRSGSLLFEIKLGALYLHDKIFADTSFPYIIAPQNRDVSFMYTKTSSPTAFPFPSFLSQKYGETDSSGPLFELLYEKKPLNVQADHRFVVTTRSLDVVYNPQIVSHITDFFCLHYERVSSDSPLSGLRLTEAARARYEVLKQQTKAELRQQWDQILDGDEGPMKSSRWSIELAISAPQIIIPKNIFDKNSIVVVFDLGKLQFFNTAKEKVPTSISFTDDIDDDEDFLTPCSTPQELSEQLESPSKSETVEENVLPASPPELLKEHMYERYTLELSDIQVLVSRLKDNWKFAQLRGTSTMHILDRFSILVQMERRLAFIQDPLWPAVTLSGNLPKLIVHVSEQKVSALQTCLDIMNSSVLGSQSAVPKKVELSGDISKEEFVSFVDDGVTDDKMQIESGGLPYNQKSVDEESLLLLMQFCVDQMSFDVQSRGRSVAELQVTGVKTTFSKRPFETSVTLCVHSLLLVDALQTYGPDFELLMASHKHVSMDSTSGSLRDSDPSSPASPDSPDAVQSPRGTSSSPTPPLALSAALSTLQSSNLKAGRKPWNTSSRLPISERSDSDALITVEFSIIESPTPSKEGSEVLQISTVQFNSLDIIANQETIVELVGFVKRASLRNRKQSKVIGSPSAEQSEIKADSENEASVKKQVTRTEITFDFHRLNVLLLRAVSRNHSTVGLKVATATMSGARIQATIGSSIEIEGALGGLQVLDLITENTKHPKIISVGYDPLSEHPVDLLTRLQDEMYKPVSHASDIIEPQKALTFCIVRHDAADASTPIVSTSPGVQVSDSLDSRGELEITVRMASLCYTHSPSVLYELSSCATEFKDYMSALASSIKSAATEVAIGIVTKRTESISAFRGGVEASPTRRRHESVENLMNDGDFLQVLSENDIAVEVKIDVMLQTPVVVVPCSPSSYDVLVAHLGHISVQNKSSGFLTTPKFTLSSCDPLQNGTIFVEVRDMNLYFLNIEKNMTLSSDGDIPSLIVNPNTSVRKIYFCGEHGQPILHDTILEILIQPACKADSVTSDVLDSCFNIDLPVIDGYPNIPEVCSTAQMKVKGRVVTPLKVVLTKHQYQRILKTLDYITYDDPSLSDTCFRGDVSLLKENKAPSSSSFSMRAADVSQCNTLLPPPVKVKGHTSVQAVFELPDFSVELRGDVSEREEGIVSMTFQEFVLKYDNERADETSLQVTLRALLMEDLRESNETSQCYLMMSSNHNRKSQHYTLPVLSQHISVSCPDISGQHHVFYSNPSSSLPDHLHTQNLFSLQSSSRGIPGFKMTSRNIPRSKSTESYPSTPPPSPSPSAKESKKTGCQDALVCINVLLIDKKSPLFLTKYKKTNRFIDIDFNCLDVTLNLQTWVMVLDFFGIGSDVTDVEITSSPQKRNRLSKGSSVDNSEKKLDKGSVSEVVNSEVELTVRSLTVILNKVEYKLGSANISNYYSHMTLRDNNFNIQGKLGSISLIDLTPHGQLYPERFVTTGTEALHFNIFRYGKSNPSQQTDYDISVKCQMSSVRYVHTHRFLSEITAFFQRFTQLQDIMGKIRAAASGAIVDAGATSGSRILLDISAGSPVIIIPQKSSAEEVLVADLGKLMVHNTFLLAGSPGTIQHSSSSSYINRGYIRSDSESESLLNKSVYGSLETDKRNRILVATEDLILAPIKESKRESPVEDHVCLLDVINVELTDMDLYSAVRHSRSEIEKHKKSRQDIINEGSDLLFPSFVIKRQGPQLLQQKFMFRVQVERNLDSAISHTVPDMTIEGMFSSVHVTLDVEQYKLIYGILNYNLGEPLEEFDMDPDKGKELFILVDDREQTWTSMAIHMDLVNVTVELVRNNGIANKPRESPLAKFDFIKSRLSYESYSDGSRDIDLVSNEIRVSDTRYKDAPVNSRPNVFTNILQPTKTGESKASVLQAEIHYRVTSAFTRFTVLLNNMRVMGVFDFLQNVLEFLTSSIQETEVTGTSKSSSDSSLAMQKSSFAVNTKLSKAIQPRFEIKINVTDTELVVVEDTSLWDSSAVILKSTAVITWKPKCPEKPLSCSLQSLEVFSCILGVEDDTALSIIDPVTVNIDIVGKQHSPIAKLHSNDTIHTLEVSLMNLNVRLSYYDITMFLKIIESFKRQTGLHLQKKPSASVSPAVSYGEEEIKCLEGLCFLPSDCRAALDACSGNLNEAALWLTQNASHRAEPMLVDLSDSADEFMEVTSQSSEKEINLQSAEVRVTSCCLCIIDDCKDADVPVVEMTLSDLTILQKFIGNTEGHGTFIFSADYYNRALSGWEPAVEPWRCMMKWNIQRAFNKGCRKVVCQVSADDVINVNVTSTLLDLYKTVKKNWTEDYLKSISRSRDTNVNVVHSPGCYRRRTPFMPFALKNDTGCKLSFATQITSADSLIYKDDQRQSSNASKMSSDWHEVAPGQVVAVPFESRAKIRHKDSHEMKIHQIIVKVYGWQQVAPVSVDRVGTYFRHAKPQGSYSAVYTDSFPARIVFVVALEGSARKLITVQSALLISNKLEDLVEIKMENAGIKFGAAAQVLYVLPDQTLPVPLPFAHAQLWVRPAERAVTFSNHPIAWHHVIKPGEVSGSIRVCTPLQRNNAPYRFSVCVKRMNYPTDKSHRGSADAASNMTSRQSPLQPGHKVTLLPSLEITNLLPYELHYSVKDLRITGYVKPGKGKPIYDIDISEQFGMEFSMENFKRCNEINISSSSRRYPTRLELYDSQDRLLVLQLRVRAIPGGALKLSVSAPYWLVNKTGLPLVFKQEGTHIEAAGQFEEHELARSMSPLLFSFSDRDASAMCNMRVGKSLHPGGIPQWCTRFHLEKGVRVRRLHVTRRDARPDWVYNIGIDVRMGRGRYRDTNIVTLSPRYQLDNRSSNKLEFCQLFATKESRQYILSAMPKCNLPFHWPRIDFDNLLCVRLADVPDCYWSGGFAIDNIMSFHINMRDGQGKSRFIRVEIVLQGATFFIIFTDADRLPPPMRIDNYSEVAITYYQTNVAEERLKTSVRPQSSVPYAWDEPTLPPLMTCCAPGGSIATYNMNIFREGSQLFYENFIYIAFTGTFLREMTDKRHNFSPGDITCQEYVLDVPRGSKVVISRKEAGKRSQLWRMTSTGMLQHEGSSPPRDPHKSPDSVEASRGLVLDIASLAPQPGEFTPLMLRKPDERRQLTQTWKFTADGRLRCGHPNMYVQAKDGFTGLSSDHSCYPRLQAGLWRMWNDVVLGPTLPVSFMNMENGIPIEQAISRQKLRGGSGVLSVQVIPDGPTRVLQICDLKQKKMGIGTSRAPENVPTKRSYPGSPKEEESRSKDDMELQVCLKLGGGIGLSLINHLSEELLYILLQDITVEYSKSTSSHTLDGSVKNIQIDNQLREAESSVVLYVSTPSKNDNQQYLPAVSFNVHHVAGPSINAEIFKHLIVTIKNLTMLLEERLLLKILQFAGFNRSDAELEKMDENDNQIQRPSTETTVYAEQYYFSTLKLILKQVRLSVWTTSHLPPDLQLMKKKVGLRLIRFEDAIIELDPFHRIHPFETAQSLIDSIIEHYKAELKSQAANILGAVDFLGNPLGLVNDINDGISSLIHEGNVGGLIKNVTHGLSDSAAKLSDTLSDGLGLMTMDDKHQKMRKRIRQESSAAGSDHLMTGLRGLGFGLLGGMTSLFTQTYEGAAQEGIQGFLSGLGKGLVGTVAKPAVGFLDFATGAASAVRDTSKRSTHEGMVRRRPPRTFVGPVGLLPRYSLQQAIGQEFMYSLNDREYSELFIAKEQIRSGVEDLHALVSSEQVYFLSSGSPSSNNIVLTVSFGDLIHCSYVYSEAGVIGETRHYLQLMMKVDNLSGVPVPSDQHYKRHSIGSPSDKLCKKPQVRCDSEQIARKVAQQINYAKSLHEEKTYMVATDEDDDSDEDRGLD